VLSANVVERSDFLTGAFPAPYGNALSGVMDIQLRKGNSEKREYSLQAGILGVEASAEGPINRNQDASYLVNYRYSTLSLLDKLGFGLNDAGQYKDYQDVAFNLNYPTRVGTFSVFGVGGKSKANRTDTTLLDNNTSDMGVVGLKYRHNINSKTVVNGSVSLSGTHISKYSVITGLDAGPVALLESYDKQYARASLLVKRKVSNLFHLEAGGIVSRLEYDFFLRSINPGNSSYQVITNFNESDHNYTAIGQAFVNAKQYFSDKLLVFYGVHFMHFGLTKDNSIEPRAGVRWLLTEKKAFSFGYGKHSRIENLQYYLGRDHVPGGNEIQINRNLRFTRAHHFVLSYDQGISLNHDLKLEAYHQLLYNTPVQVDRGSIYAAINEDTGFVTDSLINNGDGQNYGLEASLEKSFSNDFYYMINGSVFQSRFSVNGQPEKNTTYNANYNVHLLAGKEFAVLDDRKRLGLNLKLSVAGGKRYVPIDLEQSIEQGTQVYQWDLAFERQLPAYFRTDFQLVYRVNRPGYTVEWKLDVQNLTDHHNAAYYYFDSSTESIKLKKYVGIVPLLSCRVEF
jgi:hypothetical protein